MHIDLAMITTMVLAGKGSIVIGRKVGLPDRVVRMLVHGLGLKDGKPIVSEGGLEEMMQTGMSDGDVATVLAVPRSEIMLMRQAWGIGACGDRGDAGADSLDGEDRMEQYPDPAVVAAMFCGARFTDDVRACRREPRAVLPDLHSYMGCSAESAAQDAVATRTDAMIVSEMDIIPSPSRRIFGRMIESYSDFTRQVVEEVGL